MFAILSGCLTPHNFFSPRAAENALLEQEMLLEARAVLRAEAGAAKGGGWEGGVEGRGMKEGAELAQDIRERWGREGVRQLRGMR